MAVALSLGWSGSRSRAQEAAPAEKPDAAAPADKPEVPAEAVEKRQGPPPIEDVSLVPPLKTVPVRRGAQTFNVQMVDAALLPRDKEGIWVLDFSFRPLRLRTVEVPGKGRRIIHYLYYKVVNRTGKARMFVPQFSLVTDTGKRSEDTVLPRAVETIQAREGPDVPLLGAVSIMGMVPPSKREGIDDAVYGVAIWEGVDPKADALHIYVRGLSDGYQEVRPPDGAKPIVRYKTLRIDFIRRGDDRNLNEKEIQLQDPPYEWVYW